MKVAKENKDVSTWSKIERIHRVFDFFQVSYPKKKVSSDETWTDNLLDKKSFRRLCFISPKWFGLVRLWFALNRLSNIYFVQPTNTLHCYHCVI